MSPWGSAAAEHTSSGHSTAGRGVLLNKWFYCSAREHDQLIQVQQDEFHLKATVTGFRWLLVNLIPLTNPRVAHTGEATLRSPLHRQASSSLWKEAIWVLYEVLLSASYKAYIPYPIKGLGSTSYQEICCFTVALVFLAPTIYLKQRSKAKYQISDWFFHCLCCKNLMAFFLTAEEASFSRALWRGAGK